jgi:hypothetical protein
VKLTARFVLISLLTLAVGGALAATYQEVSSKTNTYRPAGAQMTLGEAVHAAEQEALQKNLRLADYQSPRFLYSHDNHWIIFYVAKVAVPGGHFYVDIDDRTRRAKLMLGE